MQTINAAQQPAPPQPVEPPFESPPSHPDEPEETPPIGEPDFPPPVTAGEMQLAQEIADSLDAILLNAYMLDTDLPLIKSLGTRLGNPINWK